MEVIQALDEIKGVSIQEMNNKIEMFKKQLDLLQGRCPPFKSENGFLVALKDREEINDWCNENTIHNFINAPFLLNNRSDLGIVMFETTEDAMAFKLRWQE